MGILKKITATLLLVYYCGISFALSAKTLYVGVEDINYYPQHTTTEDKQFGGYARALLDLFGQKYNYNFEYKPYPIVRLYKELASGEVDFKYPDNPIWSKSAKEGLKITYSQPVISYTDGVMVLPANKGLGVNNLKRLGTVRGFTPVAYFNYIKKGSMDTKELNSPEALLLQALTGRIEGAYINIDVGNYVLGKVIGKPEQLVFDSSLPHDTDFYYLSTIMYPDVLENFNKFLKEEEIAIQKLKEFYSVEIFKNNKILK